MNSLVALLTSLAMATAPLNEPCKRPCDLSPAGINLIQQFEGYSPFVYKDVAGYPTIGYGHLILKGEAFEEPLMEDEATALLRRDAKFAVGAVNRFTRIQLLQGQFDALGSWTFNLGGGALQKSTMLKRVNAQRHADVPAEMMKYNKAGKPLTPVRGLTVRRKAEGDFYSKSKAAHHD